jgi:UDP-N-acetylglucosamine 1-carboxyvinyltransferase
MVELRRGAKEEVMSPSVKPVDDVVRVQGRARLRGEVEVSGAKNSVLGIMAATLLTRGVNTIYNVPELTDVETMSHLLRILGAKVRFQKGTLSIDTSTCDYHEVPVQLVQAMRASIYVLGPLLATVKHAVVPLPGGCAWGPRPVNFHLEGMRALGAQVTVDEGAIRAWTDGLAGTELGFDVSSVGATVNLMMASSLARGVTRIHNAALEPEIGDLAACLNAMGAGIEGIGTSTLTIHGVRCLQPVEHEVIPDRIEAGTLLLAGAITRGTITVSRCQPGHLGALCRELISLGVGLEIGSDSIRLTAGGPLRPCSIVAEAYPGFPTDMQAQMTALLATIEGTSRVEDHVYPDRFRHIEELCKLGAVIDSDPLGVIIRGGRPLTGARVEATDLRASATLILAALAADGITEVSGLEHLDRGYERLFEKLSHLGARLARMPRLTAETGHHAAERGRAFGTIRSSSMSAAAI